jgi:transcriptional regulator with XRE-family HTH domain
MARKVNGAALREIRQLAGIPQNKLARQIGIKPSTLSHVEAGDDGLHPEKLRKAADCLGVPLNAISTVIPEPEPEEVAS